MPRSSLRCICRRSFEDKARSSFAEESSKKMLNFETSNIWRNEDFGKCATQLSKERALDTIDGSFFRDGDGKTVPLSSSYEFIILKGLRFLFFTLNEIVTREKAVGCQVHASHSRHHFDIVFMFHRRSLGRRETRILRQRYKCEKAGHSKHD